MRARGASEPGGLVEVALDESDGQYARDDVVGVDGAVAPDAGAPGPSRAARRRRTAGLVTVALVVLVVVAANAIEVRRDQARRARLGELPGVVDSLARPLAERWRVDGWLGAELGGLVLVTSPEAIRAVDPGTGATAWTLDSTDPAWAGIEYCWPPGPVPVAAGRYVPDSEVLVCMPRAAPPGSPVEVLVLDARSGEIRHALGAEGKLLNVEWVDGGVVLLLTTPDGTVRASSWDLATGDRRWETTTGAVAFRPGAGVEDVLSWERYGDVVLLTGGGGQAAVDLATGQEEDAGGLAQEPVPEEIHRMPDGGVVRWTWGRGAGAGEVVDPDGSTRFRLTSPPVYLQVDDGAVPDVLVVADDVAVRGLEAATGEERWAVGMAGASALLSVDGTLVLAHGTRTVAVDVRTGGTLWEADRPGLGYPSALTDGDVVVLSERRPATTRTELVARSLRDGHEVWRVPFEGEVWGLTGTRDGHVLVATDAAVVGLG